MLAGRIKLRTFVIVSSLAAGLLVVGLWQGCKDKGSEPAPAPAKNPPRAIDAGVVARPAPDAAPAEPVSKNALAARAHDADVLAWRTKKVKGGKGKDVTKGRPYKLNVYQDAGKSAVNRAKVDLDRDDKFDEKYTFDGDTITLQRAPADDEQYTETFHWTGDGWASAEAGGTAPSTPVPPAPSGAESGTDLAARAHDAAVLDYRDKAIGADKLKDVSKGKPYKISVYQDAGKSVANRAKVDLDRDDKWDEKYTFDGETTTLQRAPADDEQYTETFHWTGDGWATAR